MAAMEVSRFEQDVSQYAKDKEWERKQRNREYRVAARREKRNRKGDEKKQRKLNATILRRMTRNPDKYNKNAERNRWRDIEGERRRIWQEAVRQAQRLAAIHDPSGSMFNVGRVIVQDDGTVIPEDTMRRREERALQKAAERLKDSESADPCITAPADGTVKAQSTVLTNAPPNLTNGLNPDRLAQIEAAKPQQTASRLSKTQQKKRAALEPRPPPPKPTIPEHVSIPEGEENWLALWDLPDEELERRVLREKRRKAAERKALRIKQKSGKAERREARDEKRKVYRDIKLTWKAIKEEQVRERTKLKSIEDEESKKIAVDINVMERKAALDHCEALGFTLLNTLGVDEIKPRALGMRGVEVDFDAIEIGESRSDVKPKHKNQRVNLGDAPQETKAEYVAGGVQNEEDENEDVEEFIKLDVGEGQDFESLNYNHKLRRKLRRAIDNAEIRKEMLVRQRALDYYQDKGMEAPRELKTPYKPVNVKGQRILENGTFETAKQERVRARMELAEFNTQMRILRKQAKDAAVYAGLRKHAELMGKIPSIGATVKQDQERNISAAGAEDVLCLREASATRASSDHVDGDARRGEPDSISQSMNEGNDQSEEPSEPSSSSELMSVASLSSVSVISAEESRSPKRQKVDDKVINKQSESTNRDRQAMIDAESARSAVVQVKGNKHALEEPESLKEINTNTDRQYRRGGLGRGANAVSNWNVNGLPGDNTRKGKFVRLLGGEKSTLKAQSGNFDSPELPIEYGAKINADLERQYEDSVAYRKDSKRRGLGS